MRRIGTLDNEASARRFCDYLVTESIDADTGAGDDDSQWDIWIREETDVQRAREEFSQFRQSPTDQRYDVKERADKLRNERAAEIHRRSKQQKSLQRAMPRSSASGGFGAMGVGGRQQAIPVTIAVIALSVVVGYVTYFGRPKPSPDPNTLSFAEETYLNLSFVDLRDYADSKGDPFASIRKGQVWRLVTPMIMHGSMMHLAFNMIWIFVLGSAIERLQGSAFLAILLLVTQIAGMALQVSIPPAEALPPFLHAIGGTPFAIGASGAVYGLFGYLWIRPTFDPNYPIHLNPSNVMLMLGWLVLCMTGMVGNIANGAHLGGLLAGVAVAFFVVRRLDRP
ncbi:Rhomboid protease GlpG [Planctomycetes bacterium CA13]|uniref:Rhomboid protease GlpG n=2 Tax=Novipirellula herctigrandis TaxID=2527986 RepID=A0A5C5YYA3_9BACT|nr:Rhomboid protease GlpG [Planctomycetes bacterium CA13]